MTNLGLCLGLGVTARSQAVQATLLNGVKIPASAIIGGFNVDPGFAALAAPPRPNAPSGAWVDVYAAPGERKLVQIDAHEPAMRGWRRVKNYFPVTEENDWGNSISGTGALPVVTALPGQGKAGGMAHRIQLDMGNGGGPSDYAFVHRNVSVPGLSGKSASAWIKTNGSAPQRLAIRAASNAHKTIDATNEWQRFAVINPAGSYGTTGVELIAYGPYGTDQVIDIIVSMDDLGPQAEGLAEVSECASPELTYGADLPDGFVTGVGTAVFTHTNGNTVDANGVVTEATGTLISDLGGFILPGAATNEVAYQDGSAGWSVDDVTITAGLSWKGLDGFEIESAAFSSRHIAYINTPAPNQNRVAIECILKKVGSNQYVQVNFQRDSYVNVDLDAGSIAQSANAEYEAYLIEPGVVHLKFRRTDDNPGANAYPVICLITAASAPIDQSHAMAGLAVQCFGATVATGAGGSNVPYPGIIPSNSGSTVTRQAATAPLLKADGSDVSAADLGSSWSLTVSFSAQSSYPGDGNLLGSNGTNAEAPLRINASGNLEMWDGTTASASLGTPSTTAGDTNVVALTVADGKIRASLNGATAVEHDYTPVLSFTAMENIDESDDGTAKAHGEYDAMQVIKGALSNSQLETVAGYGP